MTGACRGGKFGALIHTASRRPEKGRGRLGRQRRLRPALDVEVDGAGAQWVGASEFRRACRPGEYAPTARQGHKLAQGFRGLRKWAP